MRKDIDMSNDVWRTDAKCHCGDNVVVRFQWNGFTRGLCEHCDDVRCDAYPGECGR